jgi:uncharacterized phage infection (PIP) family protein YhgE
MSEQLLSAEQAVQELLGKLQDLRGQVEGYSQARESLTETQRGLGNLVSQTRELADQTLSATKALKEVGTPEILAKISELREGTENAARLAKESVDSIAQFRSRQAEWAEKTKEEFEKVKEYQKEQFEEVKERQGALETSLGKEIEKVSGRVEERIDIHEKSLLVVKVLIGANTVALVILLAKSFL